MLLNSLSFFKSTLFVKLYILVTMNKSELVNAMSEKSGLSKTDAKKALDGFLASVADALKAGDKISLIGFGTFSVVSKAARSGINPATKQPIQIPAKKVIKFKAGAEISAQV